MRSAQFRLAILTLLFLSSGRLAVAEGWSLSSLNPFAKQESTVSRTPQLDGRPLRGERKKPSAYKRMTSGTKRFLTSTKDTLMFKKSKAAPQPVSGYSGSYQFRKPKEEKSFFSSWFSEEPEQPRTPQEWLSQPRPMP